jgi:phosphatidylinositol glycan class S
MSTSPQLSNSLKDPSRLSFESTRTRRLILGSYWAVVLLALPLWWYTTSIERLSLPASRVLRLREQNLRFPLHLLLDTGGHGNPTATANDYQRILDQQAMYDKDRWEGLDVNVHPKLQGGNCMLRLIFQEYDESNFMYGIQILLTVWGHILLV